MNDAQQLNEQQRHGQEPIEVTVGIVEWLTSQGDLVVAEIGAGVGNTERVLPGVEDPDIVVACDGRDQTREGQSSAVLLQHLGQLQTQENGGRAQNAQAKRAFFSVAELLALTMDLIRTPKMALATMSATE